MMREIQASVFRHKPASASLYNAPHHVRCRAAPAHIPGSKKKEIHIDFLYIDSDGLEVIFKLSLSRETANGVLYAKFKKVSAHFEIVDNAPRMMRFGGRKKILQEVDLSRLDAPQ